MWGAARLLQPKKQKKQKADKAEDGEGAEGEGEGNGRLLA